MHECQCMIKREIRHSHYAQPELVENLLLASEVAETERSLSMESILSLIQFAKKKKWLCPWGPELVDETHRLMNTMPPAYIQRKDRRAWTRNISASKIHDLLSDEKQQWDRITLRSYYDDSLDCLHLHPCEELRMIGGFEVIEREDFEAIAKCTSLRLIDLDFYDFNPEDLRLLESLPNLEKIVFHSPHAMYVFDFLEHFQHLTTLHLNTACSRLNDDMCSPVYPFVAGEISDALSYISARNDTIRHLHLSITVGPIAFASLGLLKNVESIFLEDVPALTGDDFDIYILFMSPNIQQSVRHLYFHCTRFDKKSLSHLAKFRNLQSIYFDALGLSTKHVRRIISASADTLRSVTIAGCSKVGDALLEAIAGCNRLRNIDILETGVTVEAIEKYKEAKRPFWQVLTYKARRYAPRDTDSSSSSSDTEVDIGDGNE